jgi:membrane-bound lytic murein transglycosylase D
LRSRHAGLAASASLSILCLFLINALNGCAGSHKISPSALAKPPVAAPAPVYKLSESDSAFLASEVAAEAVEYIRLGKESQRDSAWFDAAEYFDSAMVHLAELENEDSLNADIRTSVRAYQDSVRDWLVQSVSQVNRLGEAADLSDLLNREIEEVPDSEIQELDAELKALPDHAFELIVPKPLPPPVLQALRVFTGHGRGYFSRWLQRKGRYDSLITAKLSERGMPKDLVYLSMVESGFSSKAWSHKSASGLWQFISSTGRRYGLKDDWWEDPRREPERATEAALDYLEDLYAEFNDWHLAMAAYNCGEGRIRREMDRHPDRGYWQMRLPEETRLYVPKILAAMIIGHNPGFFGFDTSVVADAPLRFDTATVARCLSLRSIAKIMGITEDSLKTLNPALRRWCTPPGRKAFTLRLPEGGRDKFYSNYDRIDTVAVSAWTKHVVRRGDNLRKIAARYGTSVAAVRQANQLTGNALKKGQVLIIPVPGIRKSSSSGRDVALTGTRHKVQRGETLYDIARNFGVSVSALRQTNGLTPRSALKVGKVLRIPSKTRIEPDDEQETRSTVSQTSRRKVHVVRKGETLYSIAKRLGVTADDLQRWNGLRNPDLLAGQKLVYQSATKSSLSP